MNFGTATTAATNGSYVNSNCSTADIWIDYEEIKRKQAIAAEENRRRFVALCVRFKPTVRKIRTVAISVQAFSKRITRRHKTKQSKVLQMRFA